MLTGRGVRTLLGADEAVGSVELVVEMRKLRSPRHRIGEGMEDRIVGKLTVFERPLSLVTTSCASGILRVLPVHVTGFHTFCQDFAHHPSTTP